MSVFHRPPSSNARYSEVDFLEVISSLSERIGDYARVEKVTYDNELVVDCPDAY